MPLPVALPLSRAEIDVSLLYVALGIYTWLRPAERLRYSLDRPWRRRISIPRGGTALSLLQQIAREMVTKR